MPPAPAYATDPATAPWSVGNAFTYAWAKFQQYLSAILIAMLILFVIGAIISFIWFVVIGMLTRAFSSTETISGITVTTASPGFFITLVLGALGALVYYTVYGFIQAAIARAALAITEGRPVDTALILSTDKLGPIIVTAFLVSVFTAIGYLFCGIGSLVVSFFLTFTFYFLLDQNLAPFDAIKASFNLVKDNLADVFILFIVSAVVTFIGFLLCFVGIIVAAPLVVIATAFTYKKLTNQAVAA